MKKLLVLLFLSLLMISAVWGQSYLINEGFESTTFPPTGWTNSTNGAIRSTNSARTGSASMAFNGGADAIYTPQLSNPNQLSFWYRRSSKTTAWTLNVQMSTDASSWTSIGTITEATETYQEFTYDLSSYSNIYVRLLDQRSTGNHERYVDDFSITATATPTISVASATLTGFGYVYGSATSTSQSYTLSGSNLTGSPGSITVTGSTNYEVSTDDVNFSGSVNVAYTTATLSSTTIYVRMKKDLSIGTYDSENITNSGGGATSKNVTCSGSVTAPPAPNAPNATDASSIGRTSFTANWDAVSGATGYYLDVYSVTPGTYASDLIISEYIEGSSNSKAIEIYNGTGVTIDLSTYSLRKQVNGSGAFEGNFALTGSLAHGSVHIVANSNSATAIKNVANQTTGGTPLDFNGNDCVALYKSGVQIDMVGVVNQVAVWGENVTLVRNATVKAPTTSYSVSDWTLYSENTFSYLGSHVMTGLPLITYHTGYQDLDVENVHSYQVTGLNSESTYSYVVRAYNAGGSSGNSNEKSVTTGIYDYPEDVEIEVGDVLITVAGGNGNVNTAATLTPAPNTSFTTVFQQAISLLGDGPWLVSIYTLEPWAACLHQGEWTVMEVPQGGANAGYADFWIEVGEGKGTEIQILAGNGGSPTLPVELSSFTYTLNGNNLVTLQWITQTETNVLGYYIYRGKSEEASEAVLVSDMIAATNTSTLQSYIFVDSELQEQGTYYYWLQNLDMDGSNAFHGPVRVEYTSPQGDTGSPVPVTGLDRIYPNPFNPITFISYGLSASSPVQFKIYNNRGQLVRTITNAPATAGNHRIEWNGTDNNGSACSTGLYLIRMEAGKDSFTRKVVLVK